MVGRAVKGMEFERILHVLEIDKAIDLAIRVAGNIPQRRRLRRHLIQTVDWDDGEELLDGPEVGDRLKDGEVTNVFRGERLLQELEIVRHILGTPGVACGFAADLPEESFTAGPIFETQVPQVEQREELFLQLDGVVIRLSVVFRR